jgi:hypothetical protein
MVQDMFDPELYLAKFKVTNLKTGGVAYRSGRFQDVASCLVSWGFAVRVSSSSTTNMYAFSALIFKQCALV